MSQLTSRDQIWIQALEQARIHGKFRAAAITVDCSDRTVRKTLAAMEDLELLARENPRSGIWYAGPRLLRIMNITDKSRRTSLTTAQPD
jgi:hypothetical protein